MLNTVSAHIKFIHGNNIFWIIIFNVIKSTEFSFNRTLFRKDICHLNIQSFSLLITNKINLFVTVTAYRNPCNLYAKVPYTRYFQVQDLYLAYFRRTQPALCRYPQYSTFHLWKESACPANSAF